MFARLFGSENTTSSYQSTSSNLVGILLNNHSIDVKIIERYATIDYVFEFENTYDYGSKELKFEVTIDVDAFISGFTADIDGELFVGETKEKKQAKKEYIAAKQKDENAILISQIDKNIPNLFKIQTNIDADSEITLTLTIQQYLKKTFNYNELNIELLRDFDKFNITRNYEFIVFNLNIIDKRGIYDIKLPLISNDTNNNKILEVVESAMNKSNEVYTMKGKLMYKQTNMTDFMLKYKIKGEQNEYSLLYHSESKTFCHIISDIITDSLISDNDATEGGNDEIKDNVLIPRRVVFLIDRSYSMHGDKWKKTKDSTIIALNHLRIGYDRYCIIFFDQNMRQYPNNNMLLADNENIKSAIKYVQNMGLGGSTDINGPLLKGIGLIKNDIRLLNGETVRVKKQVTKNIVTEEDELAELARMMDDNYDASKLSYKNVEKEDENVEFVKNLNLKSDNYNFYMNQIILITDGEPNNGETDTNKILLNIQNENKLNNIDKYSNKISVFSFGVGSDSNGSEWTKDLNHSFLKLLALNNNGIYKRVKTVNCDTQLNDYYNILSTPILTNINIKYNSKNITNITNTKFNTLFHGNDLIICGQLINDTQLKMNVIICAITGKEVIENNKRITKPIHINKEFEINIKKNEIETKENINDSEGVLTNENNIERIWAYLTLQQFAKEKLIYNDMIEIDENEQKKDNALPMELAMKYKFVTPWTSMIVVKSKEGNNKPKKKKKKKKKKIPKPRIENKSISGMIHNLRGAVTQIEKRETHLEKKIQQCLTNAKAKSKRRDKKGALFELKKKKQLENQLQSIQGKKLDMETQIMALEDAHLDKETLKAMKTSANAMKSTVKESDLDKADELMEDINEAMDQVNELNEVNEMNEVMSQPLGQIMDDDELEAELAELEELEADELLNDMCAVSSRQSNVMSMDEYALPSVPQRMMVRNNEEDELAELEAMMDGGVDSYSNNKSSRPASRRSFNNYMVQDDEKADEMDNEDDNDADFNFSTSLNIDDLQNEDEEKEEQINIQKKSRFAVTGISDKKEKKISTVEVRKVMEVYNDDDIKVMFELVKESKDSNVCKVLVTFYNKSNEDMNGFKFIVNVPDYIKLNMNVVSGDTLLKQCGNVVTQRFELNNTKYGEEEFVVNFEIRFVCGDDGETIIKSVVKISV